MTLSRQEWLEERTKIVTASDVMAICNQSGKFGKRTPLMVYEDKVCGNTMRDNRWLKTGRRMEGIVSDWYAEETERDVEDLGATTITYHPEYPWLGATLDRRITDCDKGTAPLEIKHMDSKECTPAQFMEEEPLRFKVQNTVQMACAGDAWGSIAVSFGFYTMKWKDLDYDDKFFNVMIPTLEEFLQRVKNKNPPPPVPDSDIDLDPAKRIWSHETGETITLAGNTFEKVDLWQDLKKQARDAEKQAKALEAELRSIMQTATFGKLPDGRMLTLKETHRKAYTREVAATTYRTLRVQKAK